MKGRQHFGFWDYVVLVVVLAISAVIGVYYRFTGGKQQTVNEYLLADRKMSVLPVAFSLTASFMSAITLLGVASENYNFGTQFVLVNAAYIIGTPVAAFFFLPVFFNMQITSVYEYLDKRFGRVARLAASVSFQMQMVFYMGIVLYAPALALSAVTGISKWTAIISVGTVCTFYSTIGGMKAVLWTDVFQSVLMFAGIGSVLVRGLASEGGLWEVLNTAHRGGRLEFFRLDIDPTIRITFWTQAIGGVFTYLTLYGVNQTQVQRLLTLKNLRKSQTSLFISWPILTLLSVATSLSGLVMYHAYRRCDPISSQRISSSDQLLPVFVMDYLSYYPGIAGIFVSGIFSATLSTVSSCVNSLSAVALEDYIKPCLSRDWSDTKQAFVSKILVVLYGGLCLSMAFLAEQLGSVLQSSLTIFGVIGGPLLGLFSLGMFCTKTNQRGAIIGLVSGLAVSFWLGFGAALYKVQDPFLPRSIEGCSHAELRHALNSSFLFLPSFTNGGDLYANITAPNFAVLQNSGMLPIPPTPPVPDRSRIFYPYRISFMWLAPIGFFVTFFVGVLVSFATGCNKLVSPDLISPPFQAVCGVQNKEEPFSQKFSVMSSDELECGNKFITIESTSTELITKF